MTSFFLYCVISSLWLQSTKSNLCVVLCLCCLGDGLPTYAVRQLSGMAGICFQSPGLTTLDLILEWGLMYSQYAQFNKFNK